MGEGDVTLKLKADNSDLVKGVREAQKETQKLHDISVKGAKSEINVLQALENSLKNIQARRAGAFDEKDIDKWDKKLVQAKNDLEEYNKTNKKTEEQAKKTGEETAKSTDKAEKSSGSLLSSITKLAAGYFTVSAAIRFFEAAINSTGKSADEFKQAIAGLKNGFDVFLKSVSTGEWDNFFKRFKTAVASGKENAKQLSEITDLNRQHLIANKKIDIQIEEQRRIMYASDKTSNADKIKAADEMLRLMKIKADGEIDLAKKTFSTTSDLITSTGKLKKEEIQILMENYDVLIGIGDKYLNDKKSISKEEFALLSETAAKNKIALTGGLHDLRYFILNYQDLTDAEKDAFVQTNAAILDSENSFNMESKRIYTQKENLLDAANSKNKELLNKGLEQREKYKQAVLGLINEADKSEIESLEGVDKLKAIKELALKSIAAKRAEIIKLGEMTPEIEAAFTSLGEYAEKSFLAGMKDISDKEGEKVWQFNLDIGKKQFEQIQKEGKEAWDKILEDEKKQVEATKELAEMKAESLKKMGASVLDYISIIDELAQKEVDEKQRQRELVETEIDEKQSELETEIELYKAGYASNVAAKQKELADLKKQKDLALIEEEKARKKAHLLQVASLVAQKAVDIATIISSTAAANAKAVLLSPITFGQPWVAINTISAALGISAAVAAVIAASQAKFAKGGWTGDGSQRDSTGERVAGVVHEKEFVVKRGPAHRFRDVLEAINKDDKRMIFNSFNKLKPEIYKGTTVNNVVIENDGSNKRLDQVNNQLEKLNKKGKDDSIQELSNKTIYRKGNTTRIVRR